jgi:hypothetical protein
VDDMRSQSDSKGVLNNINVPNKQKVSNIPVSNGKNRSNKLEVSDRHQPQHAGLLACVESLTETQSSLQNAQTLQSENMRRKSRGRKITFNPYDEFSD